MTKAKAGVWIDHRKALIAMVSPIGEHTALIVSKVEKHPERSGDSPLKGRYESRQVPADDSRQRALTGELNIYYDAVVAALRGKEPGTARLVHPLYSQSEAILATREHQLAQFLQAAQLALRAGFSAWTASRSRSNETFAIVENLYSCSNPVRWCC